MRKILPFLFLALTLVAAPLSGAITLVSRFEPATMAAGDYASYIITVNGSATGRMDATLPAVDGLIIARTPSIASKVSVINGDVTSFVQYTYTAMAVKEGVYTIPSFEVTVNDKPCIVPAATLKVAKDGQESTDAMLVEIDAPKSMYVGQSATATLGILFRSDLRPVPNSLTPHRSGEGIMQEPFDNSLVRNEYPKRGTTNYNAIVIPVCITAIDPGKQVFAYDADAQILVSTRQSRISEMDDPMDRMMPNLRNDMNSTVKAVRGHGEANIEVKPLPAGAPASFDGAIGTFSLSGSLSDHKTKVGEPVELTVEVQGEGNLKHLNPPKIDQSDDWRVYPPTEENLPGDTLGLKGGKKFKYLFSPLWPGQLTTPTLRFAYLDPASGKYVEKSLDGEMVDVADMPGMSILRQNQPNSSQASQAQLAARNNDGFHPISLLDTPAAPHALLPPQKQKPFLYVQILPALLLVWGVAVPLRRRRLERDPMAGPRRAYTKAAARARDKAAQAARRNEAQDFFTHARHCLQNAVCATDPYRKPETVSAADVMQLLGDGGQELRRDTNLIFNGSEAMRYGAVAPTPVELNGRLSEIAARLGVK